MNGKALAISTARVMLFVLTLACAGEDDDEDSVDALDQDLAWPGAEAFKGTKSPCRS